MQHFKWPLTIISTSYWALNMLRVEILCWQNKHDPQSPGARRDSQPRVLGWQQQCACYCDYYCRAALYEIVPNWLNNFLSRGDKHLPFTDQPHCSSLKTRMMMGATSTTFVWRVFQELSVSCIFCFDRCFVTIVTTKISAQTKSSYLLVALQIRINREGIS